MADFGDVLGFLKAIGSGLKAAGSRVADSALRIPNEKLARQMFGPDFENIMAFQQAQREAQTNRIPLEDERLQLELANLRGAPTEREKFDFTVGRAGLEEAGRERRSLRSVEAANKRAEASQSAMEKRHQETLTQRQKEFDERVRQFNVQLQKQGQDSNDPRFKLLFDTARQLFQESYTNPNTGRITRPYETPEEAIDAAGQLLDQTMQAAGQRNIQPPGASAPIQATLPSQEEMDQNFAQQEGEFQGQVLGDPDADPGAIDQVISKMQPSDPLVQQAANSAAQRIFEENPGMTDEQFRNLYPNLWEVLSGGR